MGKSIPPIPEKTLFPFINFIHEVVKTNECGSIIGLTQREQSYRINQIGKEVVLKVIDLKNYLLDDPEDLIFSKLNSKTKKTILITNADCLLEEKNSFLSYFHHVIRKNDNLSFIFFFQQNITYPWNMKLLSPYQYLFQNIYFYPKYEASDVMQFIFYLENKFKTNLSAQIKKYIHKKCGSNFWIIKEAVRHYLKTKDVKDIFNHDAMFFRLKVIFNELDEKEKNVLKKIIRSESGLTREEKSIYAYLKETNYLSPLLKEFVMKQTSSEHVLVLGKDHKIILNSIVIDSLFSRAEKRGLKHLLSNAGKIISRDELAHILWSDEKDYTDWALDQFIRRLRNKLKRLGLHTGLITTIKNRGFLLKINE